jgi:3-dehydroquinate synthase
MAVDKKNENGQLRLILLKAIGEATLPLPVEREQVLATLEHYGRHG